MGQVLVRGVHESFRREDGSGWRVQALTGGADGEVAVVRHQAPRVHLPARLLAGFPQALEEGRLGPAGPEYFRPAVAPVQEMIDSAFGFPSQRPRHGHRPTHSTPAFNPIPKA